MLRFLLYWVELGLESSNIYSYCLMQIDSGREHHRDFRTEIIAYRSKAASWATV